MKGFQTYKKLVFWIELLEQEIDILKLKQKEVQKNLKRGAPREYKSPTYSHTKVSHKYKDPCPSETALDYYLQLEDEIQQKETELKDLQDRERKIFKLINSMHNTKYKVAVLREIKGMGLTEIALELGYSEGYIKQVSMEVTRELQKT